MFLPSDQPAQFPRTVHNFSIEQLTKRHAALFADGICQSVRRVLHGKSPSDRLIYLAAIMGLTNEWVGDEIHAREELGMLPDQRV